MRRFQLRPRLLPIIDIGESAKELAWTLSISARTVENHKYRMMESLGVQSSAELVHFAFRRRLVP